MHDASQRKPAVVIAPEAGFGASRAERETPNGSKPLASSRSVLLAYAAGSGVGHAYAQRVHVSPRQGGASMGNGAGSPSPASGNGSPGGGSPPELAQKISLTAIRSQEPPWGGLPCHATHQLY